MQVIPNKSFWSVCFTLHYHACCFIRNEKSWWKYISLSCKKITEMIVHPFYVSSHAVISVNSIIQDSEGDINTCKISIKCFSMDKNLSWIKPCGEGPSRSFNRLWNYNSAICGQAFTSMIGFTSMNASCLAKGRYFIKGNRGQLLIHSSHWHWLKLLKSWDRGAASLQYIYMIIIFPYTRDCIHYVMACRSDFHVRGKVGIFHRLKLIINNSFSFKKIFHVWEF